MLNILVFTLVFNFSYLPDWNINYGINDYQNEHLNLDSAFQIQFEIDLYFFDIFFLHGSINSIFQKCKDELYFYPDCDQYRFSTGLRYKQIELGYEHLCFHPIFPYGANGRQKNNALLEGSYDKFYFNLELKGKL